MRNWIDILESGIDNWTVDPKLDDNEAEMMSKFTGYNREMRHYSQKEKREIRNPQFVKKVSSAFSKCPVGFSLYFWQTTNPDYDKTSFKGLVDQQWLDEYLGQDTTQAIINQTSSDAITIVLTNNLSDINKVSLTSPWIVAHRIAHAMVGDSNTDEARRIRNIMKSFLQKIITTGYQVKWPDEDSQHGSIFAREYHEIYGKLMGHTIGTMKSAREGRITSVYEWWYETVTQFIITGKITFKPLPNEFDEGLNLTTDPKMRQAVLKAWATFPQRIESAIMALFRHGCGKIFVV